MLRTPRSLTRGLLAATATAALLSGCAASQLGNMWRDTTFTTPGMKNVLVVAMRPEAMKRRLWEDGFTDGLAAYGAKATPSYRLWAEAVPDTQQVIEAVRRDGYDGVLVLMRQPDSEQQTWVEGYIRREAETRQSPFTGAYYTYWKDVQVPGRAETNTVANFQTDVWTTTEGGRLVWSGTTQTTEGISSAEIQEQTHHLFLPELAKSGILAKKQAK